MEALLLKEAFTSALGTHLLGALAKWGPHCPTSFYVQAYVQETPTIL